MYKVSKTTRYIVSGVFVGITSGVGMAVWVKRVDWRHGLGNGVSLAVTMIVVAIICIVGVVLVFKCFPKKVVRHGAIDKPKFIAVIDVSVAPSTVVPRHVPVVTTNSASDPMSTESGDIPVTIGDVPISNAVPAEASSLDSAGLASSLHEVNPSFGACPPHVSFPYGACPREGSYRSSYSPNTFLFNDLNVFSYGLYDGPPPAYEEVVAPEVEIIRV